MRRLQRKLFALLVSMALLCTMGVTALAHEAVDMTREGSISVTMREGETPVPGGGMTLYRVGAVTQNNGDYGFVLTGDFTESQISLKNVSDPELAAALAAYAREQKLSGDTRQIGGDGMAVFTGLEVGLYLLVQETPAKGFRAASPFLVSVPLEERGGYIYDVDASPKVAPLEPDPDNPTEEPTDGPTVPPTEGSDPTDPTAPSGDDPTEGPSGPTEPTLPQTGQLNWPVPVLAVLGLGLTAAGLLLRRENDHDET